MHTLICMRSSLEKISCTKITELMLAGIFFKDFAGAQNPNSVHIESPQLFENQLIGYKKAR